MADRKKATREEKQKQRILRRYPQLQISSGQPLEGTVFTLDLLLNGDLFFRFPRDKEALERLRMEEKLLRSLAEVVKIGLPHPLYPALDTNNPGEAFIGYRLPAGEPLEVVFESLSEADMELLATDLARTLQQWHSLEPAALDVPLPVYDQNRRQELLDLRDDVRHTLLPHLHEETAASIENQFEVFLNNLSRQDTPLVLVHGEPGPGLLFWDQNSKRLTGVVDFISAGLNDPAVELGYVAFWLNAYLGPESVELFLDEYGIGESLRQRGLFYQMVYALLAALEGLASEDSDLFEVGIDLFT